MSASKAKRPKGQAAERRHLRLVVVDGERIKPRGMDQALWETCQKLLADERERIARKECGAATRERLTELRGGW